MEKSPSWSRAHDWKSCNREKRFESSNLSFSAKKTRRFSWVFCCFDREILSHNHYLIARDGYAAELSVARSTMRVNSPVPAEWRISLSPLGFEFSLFTEFKRVVRRVLDRGAKRRACISQAPAIVFCISNILENYVYLCYNNFILNFAKEILSNE